MSDRAVSVLRTHDDRLIPVAGVYEIDAGHSAVEFVARHMKITKVRGRFRAVTGRITIAEEPETSHVEVEIRAVSLDTGNDQRDAHLRSAEFFEVERYPTITFRSTSVRPRPDGEWEVVGDLTIRDTTRPVSLRVDFDGAERSPFGDERVGFSAATELNREDFGLTWNQALEAGGVLVGKTVRIDLSVQAVAAARTAVA
jgi:polyisoprenoid-binding protein YceI